MICYKERTFCPFYMECEAGEICADSLTDDVIKKAKLWWGNDGAPIAQFAEHPECFIKKEG